VSAAHVNAAAVCASSRFHDDDRVVAVAADAGKAAGRALDGRSGGGGGSVAAARRSPDRRRGRRPGDVDVSDSVDVEDRQLIGGPADEGPRRRTAAVRAAAGRSATTSRVRLSVNHGRVQSTSPPTSPTPPLDRPVQLRVG